MRALRSWIKYQESSNIDIAFITEEILEIPCDNLSEERDSGGK